MVDDGPAVWVVQGMAGCGKTTVLAHAAGSWCGQVVWVTADGTDRAGDRFVSALAAAAGTTPAALAGEGPAGAGDGVDALFEVMEALETRIEPTLLVVDDAHELAGAPPAELVDLLARYRPARVTVALGLRHLRGLDHWRWRSGGEVRTVDGDGLRFRPWEVDTLFREHYQAPLTSGELHAVSRLTDGWAVALHLFHVATRLLPGPERRRLLTGPRLTVRSIRDYLAEQVLATVGPDQRVLLRRAAVFDRVRADRCEQLLGRAGCEVELRRLAEVGLLVPDADGTTYRLHGLLRAQLLAELEGELGPSGVAGLHRLAADVLEAGGDLAEAVRACGRGGDWDGVSRLLARYGPPVVAGAWADGAPPRVRDTDPWVLRAIGRRQLGEGDLDGARATLAASVARFREQGGDRAAEQQLRTLDGWLGPGPHGDPGPGAAPGDDDEREPGDGHGSGRTWTASLRVALAGGEIGPWPAEPESAIGEGLAALTGGRVSRATELLAGASAAVTDELGALADLACCLAAAFSRHDAGLAAERALTRARACGAPALVALAESLAAYVAGEVAASELEEAAARERHDALGAAVHGLIGGLALLRAGEPGRARATLDRAAGGFDRLGLLVPAVLARAAAALARSRTAGPATGGGARSGGNQACGPGASADVRPTGAVPTAPAGAELAAVRAAGPLPHALVLLAEAESTGRDEPRRLARALAGEHGFTVLLTELGRGEPVTARPAPPTADEPAGAPAGEHLAERPPGAGGPPAGLDLRCFGELEVSLAGRPVDVQQLRPLHQELLGILASHPDTWLHRERLFAWLWPDASLERATRNLQVGISAVRRLLEPEAAPGHPHLLVRSGERYRLVVEPGRSDIGRVEAALAAARAALRQGDVELAGGRLETALAEWTGEPAGPWGPAEWAVELRRHLAHATGGVAVAVVEALRQLPDPERAAALAARAVEADPWDDQLWRLAVASAGEAGALVLASDLARRYRHLVAG